MKQKTFSTLTALIFTAISVNPTPTFATSIQLPEVGTMLSMTQQFNPDDPME